MNSSLRFVLAVLVLALLPLTAGARAAVRPARAPRLLTWTVGAPTSDEARALRELVAAHRAHAVDGFVFLSGGASRMSEGTRARLLELFDAFRILAEKGRRFAVADGGTRTGIMEAAGRARARSGDRFPLLGIAPGPELVERGGRIPADPNHSEVIAVENPGWVERRREMGWTPARGYFGSETSFMYEVFRQLAPAGSPSVTLLANGGGITMDEVAQNVAQRRVMIVIRGSGRAADAVLDVLEGRRATAAVDEEYGRLLVRAHLIGVREHPELFVPFGIEETAGRLAAEIESRLGAR